jgi:UDP-glucose 4-epimerase
MHFAALAYVAESIEKPGLYYDVNVNGTRVLLDAMHKAGVRRLVFSSSCAVYGVPDALPIDERTRTNPINPYGYTKLVCENMIAHFGTATELRSVCLRYFNAAGADPAAGIGEDHDPEPHIIPLILDVALGRRTSVSILGCDYPTRDGTAIRDYVHVRDLASAHVAALDHLLSDGPSITANLGTQSGVSVAELIAAASRVTGKSIKAAAGPRRLGDPPALVASSARARAVFGWKPQRSKIDEILADAWAWHQNLPGRSWPR